MTAVNWACAIALIGLGIFAGYAINPLVGLLVAGMAGLKP